MVDDFEGVFASVGFNIPEPDFMFFASADEPCYLGYSVILFKAAEKQITL